MATLKKLLPLLLLLGCESPPPAGDGGLPDAAAAVDGGGALDASADVDAGPTTPMCDGLAATPPVVTCEPLDTDYAPGADDMWAACVSDDGEYHRILPDISSIARVMAFEEIAALLFDPTRDPSAMDFLDARLVYQRDEGLDSRVVRRYDPHFTVPDGTDCALDGVPDAFPDYCVGPARIGPLLLDAFAAGIAGDGPSSRVHAARVEAGLLWFLAVSTFKENLTCTTTAKDCDSSYAYYTGGEAARGGIGLAGRVAAVDPDAHDRAWDGVLAVRCWRDLDAADTATDLAMRDRARTQLDRAVLDGVAAIVRAHLAQACSTDGAESLYHWELARVLGGFLDRAARERDATQADALAAELSHEAPAEADAAAAVAAIDALFDCP
ncbi:MAG: hypothetical protein H6719_11105 [Sandaracinaceae bacterium]|nr:hypothetical protein [Sandaracinaceae bacterium]